MPQTTKWHAEPLGVLEVTTETVTERLSYRLSQIVGAGRRWSYHALSARAGIDMRTLKAYVQGTACPNLVRYKRLLAVLGPEIGTELNIMKGWLPRSDTTPPEAVNLVDLREELTRVEKIIGDGVDGSGPIVRDALCPLDGSFNQRAVEDDQQFRTQLKIQNIDARAVAARLSYRLKLMIGPNRPWQIAEVSDQAGIDRRTIQSYLAGTACPNLARFLRLSHLLGPEIGVELAYMIGWEPRFGIAQNFQSADIKELAYTVRATISAIERVLYKNDHTHARLIRRRDLFGAKDGAECTD